MRLLGLAAAARQGTLGKMAGNSTETELKIPTPDLEAVRDRLRAVGARRLTVVQREVNLLFDTEDHRLKRAGQALRLRRVDGRAVVTFKGPASYQGQVKKREELETEVANGDVMVGVFERLGWRPSFRYEKDRECWQLGQVEVALDHTPMGNFVELEGPLETLEPAADSLRFDVRDAVRGSYVGLWQEYRDHHPDTPVDMVFRT